jgi:hypothetical protein
VRRSVYWMAAPKPLPRGLCDGNAEATDGCRILFPGTYVVSENQKC